MPLAAQITEVEDAAAALRTAENELDEARERFRVALIAANDAGASLALLGRTVGLSRQRVAQIIGRDP
jgi:hypothetical protein